ncbi:MAG TPA: efflux RND transporter periplasmic adaptor subunit [Longimicrobiales bacterium]|nr:efflux RND transporter periplasmic adaptor subunit [Longimicrobiales bacterium]
MRVRVFGSALVLLLAAAVTACGGDDPAAGQQQAQGGPGGGGPGGGGPGGMGGGARVSSVAVQPVERGSIARQVTVSGIIEPVRSIGVNSQLGGALLNVAAEEGTVVRRGAVLARVDDREIRAQLAAAEANYEVAKNAFERSQQLRERQVITLPEFERDRTAFSAAESQRDQLRTRAGYATVVAPVNGVITDKLVETGDVVGTNARLFTIADVSQLVVRAGVSELDVVELSQGDAVTITLDALPNRAMRGTIRRIFPTGDPQTRLVPVEVVLSQESARLARPGFLARITFDLATSENVLLVPVSAVLGGQGAQAVFLVNDGVATRRTVQTGLMSQGRIEIVSGLQEGDPVVVTGNNTLRDGMTVRVADPIDARTPQSGREVPAGVQAAPTSAAVPAPRQQD